MEKFKKMKIEKKLRISISHSARRVFFFKFMDSTN